MSQVKVFCDEQTGRGTDEWVLMSPAFAKGGEQLQCNLSIPNLVYSEILFNPTKLFGPKIFYHLLHTKLPCVFRILYIPNSEHKIQSLEYIIA